MIAKSLPILDQIAELKESGKLDPEKAELIRRQVIDSITKFARAGVTIPEIEEYTVYNPRQLMQPDRKLLLAETPSGVAQKESEAQAHPHEEIPAPGDPEFHQYMEKMIRRYMSEKEGKGGAESDEDESTERKPNL